MANTYLKSRGPLRRISPRRTRTSVGCSLPLPWKHVPSLVMSAQDAGVSADLYEVAGHSLGSLRSAELVDYEDREHVCALAAADLLAAQLSVNHTPPDYEPHALQVLQEWLGPEFPDNPLGSRVVEIGRALNAALIGCSTTTVSCCPTRLLFSSSSGPLAGFALPCFRGPVHGDLHLRNILVRGVQAHPRPGLLADRRQLARACTATLRPRIPRAIRIPARYGAC